MDVEGDGNKDKNGEDGEGARKNKAPRLAPLSPRQRDNNNTGADLENGGE